MAFVDVVTPAIDVDQDRARAGRARRGRRAVAGPDVPTPQRPAEYLYDVINTGNVPLALTPDPTDDTSATTACSTA